MNHPFALSLPQALLRGDGLSQLIDLVAVLLLALGIKGLSKVRSARAANGLAALAMGLAVVGLLLQIRPDGSGSPLARPLGAWLAWSPPSGCR